MSAPQNDGRVMSQINIIVDFNVTFDNVDSRRKSNWSPVTDASVTPNCMGGLKRRSIWEPLHLLMPLPSCNQRMPPTRSSM